MANKEKLKKIFSAIADDDELSDLENELKEKEEKDVILEKLEDIKKDIETVSKNSEYDDSGLVLRLKEVESGLKKMLLEIESEIKENSLVKSAERNNQLQVVEELSKIGEILTITQEIISSNKNESNKTELNIINTSLEGIGNLLIKILSKTGSNDSVRLRDSSNALINPSTSDNQTNGAQKTQLVTELGANFDYDNDPNGHPHLGVALIQAVYPITANSSTTNLNVGATFTGTSVATLGVNSIQVSLKTDVNCTIFVEQSPDGNNWDISDQYDYLYSKNNFGITVQAINSYFRVRVTNISSVNSTYFRLQSVLCPIADPLPRSLSKEGYLKVHSFGNTDEYGFEAENSPNGDQRFVMPTLLVGREFEGTTVDPNYYTVTVANSGSGTQANNELTVATNTTANGGAKVNSVRRARYIPGQSMVGRMKIRLSNVGVTNNLRIWGMAWGTTMPTYTDGFYFQLNGTTFSVVTMKGSSATVVSSGNFNGDYGATYILDTNYHTYEIYWNNQIVLFTIDGKVLHTVTATSATIANTMQVHLYMESTNSGGITSNNSLNACAAGIRRLGPLLNQPTSKYQSGTTAAVICKYGTGNIHGIVISGVVNNAVVTIYDNTAASGTVIWASGAMSNQTVPFQLDFKGIPFFVGLTFSITGANCNLLVEYE